ncbi:hypothetical protein SAMN04488023_1641 [Pedobacter rhizosphaerae]|uniref:Uncharacterized protein n=1 Tax=Pedobacter rhizosphaerae TaxID=390241 RepID=A0A1H9WAA1_9SPHI|nr:hypothetical protein SAMN04488023_1641 [Pedobacter rhizosphaerae]
MELEDYASHIQSINHSKLNNYIKLVNERI